MIVAIVVLYIIVVVIITQTISHNASIDDRISLYKKDFDRKSKELSDNINNNYNAALDIIDSTNDNLTAKINDSYNDVLRASNNILSREIEKVKSENDNLKEEIEKLNEKLDYFLNINEISKHLNADDKDTIIQQIQPQPKPQKVKEASPAKVSSDHQQLCLSTLDSDQEAALQLMLSSKENIFVSGRAGTGKSYLLKEYRKKVDIEKSQKYVVAAPTGIAALLVGGVTLHSVFGYNNLSLIDNEQISEETIQLNSNKKAILKNITTLIIDEISMVRVDVFEKINRILQIVNKNNLPFGGKQLIIFGDLFQLPPIVNGKDELDYLTDQYGGIHFFMSKAYKDGNFHFIELNTNHRQDNKDFFDMLGRIREGKASTDDISILNSLIPKRDSVYKAYTSIVPTKDQADTINKQKLSELQGTEHKYSSIYKINKLNSKPNLPVADELILKNNALVMMVSNDKEDRWVNGTLGLITELGSNYIYVVINGMTYQVHRESFCEYEVKYEDGEIKYEKTIEVSQFPLVLAYAITIHKSQGQTYQNIICDIHNCFSCGQAYVALSRCVSLDGLHLLNSVLLSDIKVDKQITDFYIQQRDGQKSS